MGVAEVSILSLLGEVESRLRHLTMDFHVQIQRQDELEMEKSHRGLWNVQYHISLSVLDR